MRARLLVFALGAALLIAMWQFWPSDERRIRRLVYELSEVFDGRPASSDIERVARLAPLARVLASDVVIEGFSGETVWESGSMRGRDAVVAAAMTALRQLPDLVVSVTSVDVRVRRGTPTATATAGLSISGAAGREERWREVRELKLELTRQDDVWLVTHLEPVRVLTP